jgi:hypothetical protein
MIRDILRQLHFHVDIQLPKQRNPRKLVEEIFSINWMNSYRYRVEQNINLLGANMVNSWNKISNHVEQTYLTTGTNVEINNIDQKPKSIMEQKI